MTIEEIIHIFEHSRLFTDNFTQEALTAVYVEALAALRAKLEAERNAPLTLEELREMDGEPVWCEILVKGHRPLFGIVHGDTVTGYVPGETHPTTFKTNEVGGYGLAWLAYRRRPEGGDSNV